MLQGRFDVIALLLLHEFVERLSDRHAREDLIGFVPFSVTHDVRRQIARQNHVILA